MGNTTYNQEPDHAAATHEPAQVPADPQSEESAGQLSGRRMDQLRVLDVNFQKDKALFILQVHMWSGRRVQSDEELMALGITDIEEYKKTRTKGSKELVPMASLRDINRVKSNLERDLRILSAKTAGVKNLYFVKMDLLDEAVGMIQKAEDELKDKVGQYLDNETGYQKDREDMIQKHLDEARASVHKKAESAIEDARRRIIPDDPVAFERVREAILENAEAGAGSVLRREDLEKEYPSVAQIRGKYRVGFLIARLPVDAKLSDLVDQYQLQKIEEEARATVEQTQTLLRGVIVQALKSFKETLGSKNPDQKVNSRTITRVNNVFDQFLNVGTMFGDSRVSNLIDNCKRKFEMAESWTVEEVNTLGIQNAVDEVLAAAEDTAAEMERQQEYLSGLYADEEDQNVEGDIAEVARNSNPRPMEV